MLVFITRTNISLIIEVFYYNLKLLVLWGSEKGCWFFCQMYFVGATKKNIIHLVFDEGALVLKNK